jgi:hypothetical protein
VPDECAQPRLGATIVLKGGWSTIVKYDPNFRCMGVVHI